MKLRKIVTYAIGFFLIGISLAGCGRRGVFRPTQATRAPGADFLGAPQTVFLTELASNPQAFEGRLVRVQGAFATGDGENCARFQRGPATNWSLIADSWRLEAAGFELLPGRLDEGTELTVDGIFRSYVGPVGCGKRPPRATVWYLDSQRIVAPNPLVLRPPLGDDGAVAARDGQPLSGQEPQPGTTPTSVTPTTGPAVTPSATATGSALTPTPVPTNTPTALPETTPDATASPAASPTAGPSPTPTATDGAGTPPPPGATPTPDGYPPAPPTPTPGSPTPYP